MYFETDPIIDVVFRTVHDIDTSYHDKDYTAEIACEITFVNSTSADEQSPSINRERILRGNLMSSWTTVDAIWLSGFCGSSITPVPVSNLQPSLAMYSSSSDPRKKINRLSSENCYFTFKIQVRPQPLAADLLKCSPDGAQSDFSN